jgi:Skp family chaperone for outer membrane proteins
MKTFMVLLALAMAAPVGAAEKIAVHNAKTGQVIVRDRTAQEQAAVDAERAQVKPKRQPNVDDVIKALEKKLFLTRAEVLAEIP